jgi:hypothetical protein
LACFAFATIDQEKETKLVSSKVIVDSSHTFTFNKRFIAVMTRLIPTVEAPKCVPGQHKEDPWRQP